MLREAPQHGSTVGDDPYLAFLSQVCARQLALWLAEQPPGPVVDITGSIELAAAVPALAIRADAEAPVAGSGLTVRADAAALDCLRDRSVGALVADQGALVGALVIEDVLARAARVLRPGGGLLLSVDSVVTGMASLAASQRWAELADAPNADVVLVGNETEGFTRCFTPAELAACATEAGLVVNWVRPRTVLSAEAVRHGVGADPRSMPELVRAELRLAADHADDSGGRQLLLSASRPG